MTPGPNPSADHRDRTPADQAGGRDGAPGREVPAGLVERVTFHNPETGFCVLRIKARGHRDLVTAVGHAAMISAGEWITASGEWINDRTHGRQFRVRFLKASAPSSVHGWLSFQHPDKIANAIRLVSTVDLWQAVALRRNEDVKATKAQLCAIVDRRNKIAHEADLDPGNPGERWPIDRPLVEEAIDFIESTIRAIYEVAGPART